MPQIQVDPECLAVDTLTIVILTLSIFERLGRTLIGCGDDYAQAGHQHRENGFSNPATGGAMIGLDAGVLVRYLTQDEPVQAAIANRIIEEQFTLYNPGFIASIVLVEVVRVLVLQSLLTYLDRLLPSSAVALPGLVLMSSSPQRSLQPVPRGFHAPPHQPDQQSAQFRQTSLRPAGLRE